MNEQIISYSSWLSLETGYGTYVLHSAASTRWRHKTIMEAKIIRTTPDTTLYQFPSENIQTKILFSSTLLHSLSRE